MSLATTVMQNMRLPAELDKWVLRASRYGALNLFMKDKDNPMGILSPQLQEAAYRSIGRTIQVPVIEFDGSVSIGSSRSVTIADDESASAFVTFTFVTYSWGFTMVPSLFHNNDVGYQQDFDRKFLKYLYAFAAALDTAGITALEAAKTQVLSDTLGGKYSLTSNVVVAPLAIQDEVIGDINPLMAGNDFYGRIHVVGNPSLESLVRNRLMERAEFNEVNKTYQWADKEWHFTNRLSNGAGHKATGFAVQEGSLGMLFRFEREALVGRQMQDGTAWGIENLPMLNIPVGTYFYESKGDFSALGGAATADNTRAYKQHFGYAVDAAFVTAYNTDASTYAGPVMKFAVATS